MDNRNPKNLDIRKYLRILLFIIIGILVLNSYKVEIFAYLNEILDFLKEFLMVLFRIVLVIMMIIFLIIIISTIIYILITPPESTSKSEKSQAKNSSDSSSREKTSNTNQQNQSKSKNSGTNQNYGSSNSSSKQQSTAGKKETHYKSWEDFNSFREENLTKSIFDEIPENLVKVIRESQTFYDVLKHYKERGLYREEDLKKIWRRISAKIHPDKKESLKISEVVLTDCFQKFQQLYQSRHYQAHP